MTSLVFFLLQSAFAAQVNVPATAIEFWNADNRVSENNCYNYGTNRETDSYAQPGEASGIFLEDLHCPAIYAAASADLGLTPTSFFPFKGKQDDTLIAVVAWPDNDFHWYRRDDSGKWTHKMGGTPAQTVDNSGNPITDVEKADRGSYTDFCGYFKISNYVFQTDEQNGGMVRIGSMHSLPDPPKSTLTVSKYSGRPDPQYALADYLKNPATKNALLAIATTAKAAPLATEFHVQQMSRLGYRGIVINDREGLVFPKGTRIQIFNRDVLANLNGAAKPVAFTLDQPLALERGFVSK